MIESSEIQLQCQINDNTVPLVFMEMSSSCCNPIDSAVIKISDDENRFEDLIEVGDRVQIHGGYVDEGFNLIFSGYVESFYSQGGIVMRCKDRVWGLDTIQENRLVTAFRDTTPNEILRCLLDMSGIDPTDVLSPTLPFEKKRYYRLLGEPFVQAMNDINATWGLVGASANYFYRNNKFHWGGVEPEDKNDEKRFTNSMKGRVLQEREHFFKADYDNVTLQGTMRTRVPLFMFKHSDTFNVIKSHGIVDGEYKINRIQHTFKLAPRNTTEHSKSYISFEAV